MRISRLRRKLESNENSPVLIKTVYGAGYLFMASGIGLNLPKHNCFILQFLLKILKIAIFFKCIASSTGSTLGVLYSKTLVSIMKFALNWFC